MGRTKEFYTKYGYMPLEKYVCFDCFEDYAIKNFITESATEKTCDYCGKRSKKNIAASIDEVIPFVIEGIETEYGRAGDENLSWESREGGWQWEPKYDTWDLLKDEIELEVKSDQLFQDIHDALGMDTWCQKNPYSMNISQELIFNWRQFSEQVKYRSRYVFYRVSEKDDTSEESKMIKMPFQVLDILADFINELGIVTILPVGTKIYRCRIHDKKEKPSGVIELGPPPREKTKPSRMSPAGIIMFYGSDDGCTALEETYRTVKDKPYVWTTAEFETVKNIKILDLTKYDYYKSNSPIQITSIFESGQHIRRHKELFLINFVHSIWKPISFDYEEHIEYVPTQIVAEYFKLIYRDQDGDSVKGIIYPSSISNGENYVLFIDSKNIISDQKFEEFIKDEENDIVLKLNTDTVKTCYSDMSVYEP